MIIRLEYHNVVNRSPIPATFALCGIFLLPLLLASNGLAQINSGSANAAASVHSVNVAPPTAIRVAPPTAMSVAPPTGAASIHSGFPPSATGFAHSTSIPHPHHPPQDNNGHHPHHDGNGVAYYPYLYPIPVPYAADVSGSDTAGDDSPAEYQGGPTIFDRRGAGSESYAASSSASAAHAQNQEDSSDDAPAAESALEPAQLPTTLVFKDGHQLELNNYAIVNQTLYDLTPGHPRKIALADVDLPATEKQNDDHGIVFQLPPTAQAD